MNVTHSRDPDPPAPCADDWRGSYSAGMFESRSELSRGLDVTELMALDAAAALLSPEGSRHSDVAARARAAV